MSKTPDIVPARDGDDPTGVRSHGETHTARLQHTVRHEMSGPSYAQADVGTVNDGSTGSKTTPAEAFDPKLPPGKQKRIVDKTSGRQEASLEVPDINDKTPPKISVGLEDLNKQPPDKPHFVVKKDGSIEMQGDPEAMHAKDIKVQLERSEGQIYPTPEQKRAAEDLV